MRPPGARRNEEVVAVEISHLGPPLGFLLAATERQLPRYDSGTANFELVRTPLQEQHPEDVLLELGGIHLPAQDVGGTVQVPLQLCEGQLPVGGRRHLALLVVGPKCVGSPPGWPPNQVAWLRNHLNRRRVVAG